VIPDAAVTQWAAGAPWPTRTQVEQDLLLSRVFLRTFLPWQLWRFVRINLKMMGIIRHRS
jgi:hypothetical protein